MDYSNLYKADFVNKLKMNYSFLYQDGVFFNFILDKLFEVRGFFLVLINNWRVNLLHYICESILNRENYILILLDSFYKQNLFVFDALILINYFDLQQRNNFLRKSL